MGNLSFCKEDKGFPKIWATILGVPIIRTIVYWGLSWGPPILGNYQIRGLGFRERREKSGLVELLALGRWLQTTRP